jgi:magnesium chelatase family protein
VIVSIYSAAIQGLEAQRVVVETDIGTGLPECRIVGLPDAMVNESRDRVKAAIRNSGFEFPQKKVTINLAPASLRKEGTGFDLSLATGILLAAGQLPYSTLMHELLCFGELSLEGKLRPAHGALAVALLAKELGMKGVLLHPENAREASLVEGINIYAIEALHELATFLDQPAAFELGVDFNSVLKKATDAQSTQIAGIDFADIKGQQQAKRALEVAVAGGHNLLLSGPPGSGKSMLAKAMRGILPPMGMEEILEVSRIYSVSGLLPPEECMVLNRPFRNPHHSASMAGLCGGGSNPRSGEITLAHRGILFLDELVEFPRPVLEVLRQPLENGEVTISRAKQVHTFPARFMLVAAMNPCPCGYHGDSRTPCRCSPQQVERYRGRISGPLLDRIDLQLTVPRLAVDELMQTPTGVEVANQAPTVSVETSAHVKARVLNARTFQQARNQALGIHALTNAELAPAAIRQVCALDETGQRMMRNAVEKLDLSARGYDRLLRVARTIADLNASSTIEPPHLAEALQYRSFS